MGLQCVPERAGRASAECRWFAGSGSAELDEGVLADTRYELPISISNSFGVPSRDPDEWQPDMQKAIAAAGDGQLLVPSSKAPAWRAWIVKRISPIMSPPRIWLPKLALA